MQMANKIKTKISPVMMMIKMAENKFSLQRNSFLSNNARDLGACADVGYARIKQFTVVVANQECISNKRNKTFCQKLPS